MTKLAKNNNDQATKEKSHHFSRFKGNLATAPPQRTSILVWLAAVVCTIITIAVIIVGIVVFIGYLVIHPRVPIISVVDAHLDQFLYDPTGVLVTQVSIVIRSQNHNLRAHASFSGMRLTLIFDGVEIARLVSMPYDVKRNSSVDFNYQATSKPVPLNPQQMEDVDALLNQDLIRFELKGSTNTRWRVGVLGSVDFSCHLECMLRFHRSNGSYIPSRCSSTAK